MKKMTNNVVGLFHFSFLFPFLGMLKTPSCLDWESQKQGLKACRAALALAKRGINVTQGFIFLALGGCGLTLFTTLLATSLGEELHKYFDPYLFYDDEELRKTVDLLVGGLVFSGQERPQGGSKKKMQIHLWKKFNSGEGLRARLPYSILTRMIRLLGWVRLEVNSALEFYDISELEYESILRRACLIEIYARFFDQAYLDKHLPNHEDFGIFGRKPHLEHAFATLPYAGAWNRTQHAFEEKHGQQQCMDIIVNFCRNDGDRGRTDAFIRECCHLEKRDKEFHPFSFDKGVVCGAQLNCDLDTGMAVGTAMDDSNFRIFAVDLMRELCDRKMDSITKSYFMQKQRQVRGSSLSRDEIWAKLNDPSSGWTKAEKFGKQSGDVIRPCIKLRRDRKSLFSPTDEAPPICCDLPETFNVTAVTLPRLTELLDNISIIANTISAVITTGKKRTFEVMADSPSKFRMRAKTTDDSQFQSKNESQRPAAAPKVEIKKPRGRPKKAAVSSQCLLEAPAPAVVEDVGTGQAHSSKEAPKWNGGRMLQTERDASEALSKHAGERL